MSDQNPNNKPLDKSLSDLYKNWYIDYASYVILERAIPNYEDGLKPVQRRILHAMKTVDDGRFNKVANIIGQTMQFHPHGDAAINDALVKIGQKELLVETQGNWGDVRTGDRAAASRYIEARLSKFAKKVMFNNNITTWSDSYDGRNKEPVSFPVKFPTLLYHGAEGIAVGLSTKILPHNLNEIIKSIIKYLQGKSFTLYPDFKTAGKIDVSAYKNGKKGGKIRVRANIDIIEKNILSINDVPYGVTTSSLIESILRANEKGKIKIKNVEDNTSENVEILVYLKKGISPNLTKDALYAFTNCEISISPNCCVIVDNRPEFLSINELLKISVDKILKVFLNDLEYKKNEQKKRWHTSTLEKIFIEQKIYQEIEKCKTWESVISVIRESLVPYSKNLNQAITDDDIVFLTNLKIKKISKYDIDQTIQKIKGIEDRIDEINYNISNLTDYVISFYEDLISEFGSEHKRRTLIETFDIVAASDVAAVNKKLYVDKKEGFIGTTIRDADYVCECSPLDDIIVFFNNGTFVVTKVDDKKFVGKNICYVNVWKKNDTHMIYNYIYMNKKSHISYSKRFSVTSIVRDKNYTLTKGAEDAKVIYFTANENSESEIVNIYLDASTSARNKSYEFNFVNVSIKNRTSKGNIVSKYKIRKVERKTIGESSLGGKEVWLDRDIGKINFDKRGVSLGNFDVKDCIIVVSQEGFYSVDEIDINKRYKLSTIPIIAKYSSNEIISCVYKDGLSNNIFIKRFEIETTTLNKEFFFINDNPRTKIIALSVDSNPVLSFDYRTENGSKKTKKIFIKDHVEVKGWKSIGNKTKKYLHMSNFIISNFEENDEQFGKTSKNKDLTDKGDNELTLF